MHKFFIYDFLKINRKRINFLRRTQVICLLFFASYWSFAIPIPNVNLLLNFETNVLGDPCSRVSQGDSPSSGGAGFNAFGTSLAADVPVYKDTSFEIKTIKVGTLSTSTVATYFNVIIRDSDSEGPPGNILYAFYNVPITGFVLKGYYGNYNVREYTLNISAQNLILNAPTSDKTYWMQIQTDDFSWETTQNIQIGKRLAYINNFTEGNWVLDSTRDLVYELIGECTGCWPDKNFVAQPTFTSANISWEAGGTETSWEVSWGPTGYTPGDSNQMGTQTVNSPIISITGLTAETNYKLYVRSVCGVSDFSSWVAFPFFSGYCIPYYLQDWLYTEEFSTTGATTNANYTATDKQEHRVTII